MINFLKKIYFKQYFWKWIAFILKNVHVLQEIKLKIICWQDSLWLKHDLAGASEVSHGVKTQESNTLIPEITDVWGGLWWCLSVPVFLTY